MNDLLTDVAELLQDLQPQRLLLVVSDDAPAPPAIAASATTLTVGEDFDPRQLEQQVDGRFELAIVLGALQRLDQTRGEQLLGRIRDLHAQRMLVASPLNGLWQKTHFIAFAMKELNRYEGEPNWGLYEYNLSDYKNVPDWLNSRFWANPEQWNKHRW